MLCLRLHLWAECASPRCFGTGRSFRTYEHATIKYGRVLSYGFLGIGARPPDSVIFGLPGRSHLIDHGPGFIFLCRSGNHGRV